MTTKTTQTAAPAAETQAKPGMSLAGRLVEVTRRGIVHWVLIAIALIWLVPSLGLLVTSFRPRSDIAQSGWWTVPADLDSLTTGNYEEVLTRGDLPPPGFLQNLRNSFIITIPATLLPIGFAAFAAYAFAWLHFPGRNVIYLGIISLLVIPLQTTWVPVLRLYNIFGVTGSWSGIWFAHTAYAMPFSIFLLRNFFADLPREVFESAKVDGASEWGIFWRIVVPLSVPALASLGIFQFVWVWNDLMNALIFLQTHSKYPLTVGIQNLLGQYGSEWHLLAAGAYITMSVPLIIFFSLQRYFIRGVTAGAVKG